MVHAIRMPKPGQMTETCVLSLWRKEVGDQVRRGDVLFEIETDKSLMEVEAFDDGVLLARLVEEGTEVPVNSICAYVGEPGEAIPDSPADTPAPPNAASPGQEVPAEATARSAASHSPMVPSSAAPGSSGAADAGAVRLRISPRAAVLASEAGLDPRGVTGTGPGGRIIERDVLAAIAARGQRPTIAGPTPDAVSGDTEETARPLSRMRRVIAERLTQSWTTAPQFTVTVAVDVTKLVELRAGMKAAGVGVTITDFVLASTAQTLVEFPDVNARTDGVSIWPRSHIHLGVAVSLPAGLVVPVIRDADRLSVVEIHDRSAALAAAARDGTLSVDDMAGSTFTVSNLGMFGVEEFSAIINPGESAILAVASAIPTPVADGDAVRIRSIMRLTLTADHRIVDGAMAARFLGALRNRLENMTTSTLDLPAARPAAADSIEDGTAAKRATAPVQSRVDHGPDSFDLVVLGAGTGGYSAAFRAAQLGLKVALVDEDKIGGTCLHRGCIPTKAILESAELAFRVRQLGSGMGVNVGDVSIDYAAVARRKDDVVRRMWTGLKSLVRKNNVEWIAGRGRLEGPGRVRVRLSPADAAAGTNAERVLEATDVILATGSRVKSLPGIVPDGRRVLTSDDVLQLTSLPASIVIVGAGAVGAEFASAFHDFGVAVTLLEYLPAIVPLEDRDVSKELERSFRKRGITVITNARFDPASLVLTADGIRLTVGPDGGEAHEIAAEAMLVATGRAANIEDLGLETTRVVATKGLIEVDEYMRTAEPHVMAIGDIVGGLWLAHTAAHEGLTAVHTIIGDAGVHAMDYTSQPRATFTRPEIASIGLTEQQCEERGLATRIGKVPFAAIAKAVVHGDHDGFAKVIADATTGVLLGVHIIGPHATDLIAEASLATVVDATSSVVGGATHPHPTLSEILGEAAMAVDGRSLNF
jgi:dihydrolipoamide dehydrogenase